MIPDPRDRRFLWFMILIQYETLSWQARNISKRCVSMEELKEDTKRLLENFGIRERPMYAM